MVVSCCAPACTERFKRGGQLSFHSFPLNASLRQEWVIATTRKNFVPTRWSRICGKHFLPTDYVRNFGKLNLKEGAVPSQFDFPKALKKKKSQPRRRVRRRLQLEPIEGATSEDDIAIATSSTTILDNVESMSVLIDNKKCAAAEDNELSNNGDIVVKEEFSCYNDTDINEIFSGTEKATQEVLNEFTDNNTSPETKPANIHTNRAAAYERPTSPFLTESDASCNNDAQNSQNLAAMDNAAALKALGDAIKSVANALTEATEIRKIEAEAKLMKAQASLVKARALQTSVRIQLMEYLRNKDNK